MNQHQHTRHFEIGEHAVQKHEHDHDTITDADIVEVIAYTEDGRALGVFSAGLRGIFKSRKEAIEATGVEPRRCTLAGIPAWQGVYAFHCKALAGLDELGLARPVKSQMLTITPRNAREKAPADKA